MMRDENRQPPKHLVCQSALSAHNLWWLVAIMRRALRLRYEDTPLYSGCPPQRMNARAARGGQCWCDSVEDLC